MDYRVPLDTTKVLTSDRSLIRRRSHRKRRIEICFLTSSAHGARGHAAIAWLKRHRTFWRPFFLTTTSRSLQKVCNRHPSAYQPFIDAKSIGRPQSSSNCYDNVSEPRCVRSGYQSEGRQRQHRTRRFRGTFATSHSPTDRLFIAEGVCEQCRCTMEERLD